MISLDLGREATADSLVYPRSGGIGVLSRGKRKELKIPGYSPHNLFTVRIFQQKEPISLNILGR
jgi:hypothetical protein